MTLGPVASHALAALVGGFVVCVVLVGLLFWYVCLWRDDIEMIHAPSTPSSSDASASDVLPGGDPLEAAFALDAEPPVASEEG